MLLKDICRRGTLGVLAATLVVGFTAVASSQSRDRFDRRVTIVNDTGVAIVVFNASNVNTNDWEENILGSGTLEDGESVVVNIDDGTGHCRYDFRAVFADEDVVIDRDINVCEVDTHRYFVGN